MEKLNDFALIVDQATRGELVFPTSVNAALRLQMALADPDADIEDVIRKVLAEPLLAARTVALANAAVFNRGGQPVTSVRAALARVGYRNLYTMAAAMVVRQFGSRIRDAALRARAEQLWRHSAHVAALAHVIWRRWHRRYRPNRNSRPAATAWPVLSSITRNWTASRPNRPRKRPP
jgi:HD-like signal output (HDOD) protein